MNQLEVENYILNEFKNNGFKSVEALTPDICDLFFQHLQFDYNIFLKFYNSYKELNQEWFEVQEKLKRAMSKEKILPYNTYLVFALPEEDLPSKEEIQKIIFDEYVCRKLIFPIDSTPEKLKENILKFPFFPLDISVIAEQKIPKDVVGALLETDFDQQLISDITKRIIPSQIVRKIMNSEYKERVKRGVVERPEVPHIVSQSTRKLKWSNIENFRGIGNKVHLDLDADIIAIYGPNGTGKTSVFDAIEWAVTGQVERLQKPIKDVDIKVKDILINLFHKDKPAEVNIELNINGKTKNVKRTLLSSELGKSQVVIDNRKVQDKTTIAVVTGNESLKSKTMDVRRLRDCFSASHILKQDILKKFVSAGPDQRYDWLSYIFGTQDFVRFRDKLTVIINEVNKEIKRLQNELEETLDQSNERQQRVTDKETEYKQLSQTIESFSETSLVKEMKELLEIASFSISADFINRLKSPTRELAESISKTSSEYIDSTSRDLDVFTSFINQNTLLIQKEQKTEETKGLLKNLTKEIKSIEEWKQTLELELAKKKQKFLTLEKDRDRLKDFVDNIDWLLRIKPFYEENNKRFKELNKEVKEFHVMEKETMGKISQIDNNKNKISQKLQDRESRLFKKLKLIEYIRSVLESIPEWEKSVVKRRNIIKEISELDNQLSQIQVSNDKLHKELDTIVHKIVKVESKINLQRKEYDQKVQLIGRLKEYINSPECPLCGQKWDNIKILLARVGEQTKELPEFLKIVLAKEKELKTQKERTQLEIHQYTFKTNELKSKRELLLSEKQEIETNIELWEKKLHHLPPNYISAKVKIDDKSIPERESLEQAQSKLEQEINILRETKAKIEHEFAKVNEEYRNFSERLAQLRKNLVKKEEIFNSLNQTLNNIQKEIRKKNLVETATEKLSSLTSNKEKYTEELRINIDMMKGLENELVDLHNKLAQINLNDKKLLGKSSVYNKSIKEFCTLQEEFLRIVRPYVSKAEEKSLKELLKIIQGLKNDCMRKYQVYSSLKKKADDLKRVIILDILKDELQNLRSEKAKVENKIKELKKKLKNAEKWNRRLESLKKDTIKYRKLQEQNYFALFKPTINLLYHRLNAHPLLGNIEILSEREELKIVSKISILPKNTKIDKFPPSHVFSEAQLNTLAISIFLASAIEQGWSRFKTILIDDPVQNMDDLNSYAFLDLMLGLANNGHQFIISTCNEDLYKLMLMKFRCLNKKGHRFRAYRLQGIYRDGPKVIEDSKLTDETFRERAKS